MKYRALFFRKLEKMSQNLSIAAGVIGAFRAYLNAVLNWIIKNYIMLK